MRLLRRFVSWYGADPLHLLALAGCAALAAYAGIRLWDGGQPIAVAIWLLGAVIAHDLVLFPLYGLADRSTRAILHRRRSPRRAAPGINYLRVPVVLSALLLLVYFPLVLRRPPNYEEITTVPISVYLARYLAVVGALFLAAAVAYAVRLRRAGFSRRRACTDPGETSRAPARRPTRR